MMKKNTRIRLWPTNCDFNTAQSLTPEMILYPPHKNSNKPSAAMLICPGGGYCGRADYEGEPYAQLLSENGIFAAVLHYRIAPDRFPASYLDACRAMRIMRSKAHEFNIDPSRIGIWGSSAGGHLAATLATQPELCQVDDDDLTGKIKARPDRLVLSYPVISMHADFTHIGSRNSLVGNQVDMETAKKHSAELNVTSNTPNVFIFHTADDPTVSVKHSLAFTNACIEKDVSVELHVYEHGPHGVALARPGIDPIGDEKLATWSRLLLNWLGDWCV